MAAFVAVYSGNEIVHAGIVNANGTYNAKGGGGNFGIEKEMTLSEFLSQHGLDYSQGTLVYYK